jgi:hypothetical protein
MWARWRRVAEFGRVAHVNDAIPSGHGPTDAELLEKAADAAARLRVALASAVVGPEGWSVEYRQLGSASIICRLTVLGVVREDVGEPSADGDNPATESLAQAFKRTCSAFGLGRYLYSLPRLWAAFDAQKKAFKDPIGVVRDIYQQAGLQ